MSLQPWLLANLKQLKRLRGGWRNLSNIKLFGNVSNELQSAAPTSEVLDGSYGNEWSLMQSFKSIVFNLDNWMMLSGRHSNLFPLRFKVSKEDKQSKSLGIDWRSQSLRSNTFKWSRSRAQTRTEFRLLESRFHIFINIISLCKDSIEFGFEESWFHFSGDRLERFKLKKFFDCLSSCKLPATFRFSSNMKLKLLLGIYTSFLQSLKFNELKFIKCLIEEGSL